MMTDQGKRMSLIMENSNEFGSSDVLRSMEEHASEEFSVSSTDDKSMASDVNGGNARVARPEIAARENTGVKFTKFLVLFVMLAAAAGVGYLTYWYVSEEEADDYRQQVCTGVCGVILASVVVSPMSLIDSSFSISSVQNRRQGAH